MNHFYKMIIFHRIQDDNNSFNLVILHNWQVVTSVILHGWWIICQWEHFFSFIILMFSLREISLSMRFLNSNQPCLDPWALPVSSPLSILFFLFFLSNFPIHFQTRWYFIANVNIAFETAVSFSIQIHSTGFYSVGYFGFSEYTILCLLFLFWIDSSDSSVFSVASYYFDNCYKDSFSFLAQLHDLKFYN